MEDGLRLTTISRLFAIITALSLGIQRVLALLVLCDFVRTIGTDEYGQLNRKSMRLTCASCRSCPCSLMERRYRSQITVSEIG